MSMIMSSMSITKAESPSTNLLRAVSSGGSMPLMTSFLREKYNTVENLMLEKKKYKSEERKILRNIAMIEKRLGKKQSNSPFTSRYSASQGSKRATTNYDKDAARARIRAKSAQILRDKELNKVHPSNRKSKHHHHHRGAFITAGGRGGPDGDSDSEAASVGSYSSSKSSVSAKG